MSPPPKDMPVTKLVMLTWMLSLVNAREGHADWEDIYVDAARMWLEGLIERECKESQR